MSVRQVVDKGLMATKRARKGICSGGQEISTRPFSQSICLSQI